MGAPCGISGGGGPAAITQIRRIVHVVRLIVADHDSLFSFQQRHEEKSKPRVAIVEHASMPGPRHAHKDRGEAVQRDQRRRPAGLASAIEFGFDTIMVGPENLAHACGLAAFAQADVSRYRGEIADVWDRFVRTWHTVAVDDQARIVLAAPMWRRGRPLPDGTPRRCRCPRRCGAGVPLQERQARAVRAV